MQNHRANSIFYVQESPLPTSGPPQEEEAAADEEGEEEEAATPGGSPDPRQRDQYLQP